MKKLLLILTDSKNRSSETKSAGNYCENRSSETKSAGNYSENRGSETKSAGNYSITLDGK
jgi:hypothetical protein